MKDDYQKYILTKKDILVHLFEFNDNKAIFWNNICYVHKNIKRFLKRSNKTSTNINVYLKIMLCTSIQICMLYTPKK